jgi:hypothetical protein
MRLESNAREVAVRKSFPLAVQGTIDYRRSVMVGRDLCLDANDRDV